MIINCNIATMVPKVSKSCLFAVFTLIFVVPIVALIVASMSISLLNFTASCGGNLMSLSVWLIVNSCSLMTFLVVMAIMLNFNGATNPGIVISFTLNLLFIIIWTIVGAVVLFRDSFGCYSSAHSLWSVTLATLNIQWVYSLFVVCAMLRGFKIPTEDQEEGSTTV